MKRWLHADYSNKNISIPFKEEYKLKLIWKAVSGKVTLRIIYWLKIKKSTKNS